MFFVEAGGGGGRAWVKATGTTQANSYDGLLTQVVFRIKGALRGTLRLQMQWHPARWCGVVHAGWRADIDPAHDRCRSIVRCPNDCTVGIVGGYLCGDVPSAEH